MKTCLIVDDSAVIRKIVRQNLESFGFSCREAENGAVACESCSEAMPELIMLDWNMPVMTGIEFLRTLRAMESGDSPVVIFCTTENDMEHIQQALEAGVNDFIMKPFDTEIMRTKLEQNGLLDASTEQCPEGWEP